MDNRGVGVSDQPKGPYTTKMMAADTIAVMDELNIPQAKVAGISMGGAIAQELAINYPDRVSCLVLISTWPIFNNYAKTVYENLKKLRVTSKPDDFMELLQLWIFAPPYYEEGMADLKEGQQGAADNLTPQTQNGFEGQLDACIHHDSVDRLHQIKVPTLITIGGMDIFTPPPMIKGNYEKETGFQILKEFKSRGLSYEEVEMVLLGNHAPFTWGKTVNKAVYNSAVLEECARMAYLSLSINPLAPRLKDTLIQKHYERKHGPDSYYGQVK